MKTRERAGLGWLLVLAPLPLFTTGQLYHFPLVAMALMGTVALFRRFEALRRDDGARLVFWLFLGLWLPQLLALPDAVAPAEALEFAVYYLEFPLAALFMLGALGPGRGWSHLSLGIAVIVLIWGLDLVPGALGLVDWPELQPDNDRIVEGALLARYNLGYLAGVLAPVVLELVRRYRRSHRWLLALPPVLCAVVLLSGQFLGWLMLGLGTLAYLAYLLLTSKISPKRMIPAALPVVLAAALVVAIHSGTRDQVRVTLGLFSADSELVDLATSYRLDIWSTGRRMAEANWLDGVGISGFAEAYDRYAAPDDYWLQDDRSGAHHAHLFLLEIWAETGVFGVLGYAFALWMLWRRLRSSPPDRSSWVWPLGIAVALALFPLNAHAAFYSYRWSGITWWLIGLTAAAISGSRSREDRRSMPLHANE